MDDRGVERLRRALDAPDLEGDRYRVLDRLGEGGMGTVYLAEDRLLGRTVAIKVLHLEGISDEGVERMTREARTLARLEHPGIVPIHDLGRLADGRVFYAMKHVKGQRLDEHVTRDTPNAERLRLFLKVCEAVGFAHAAGVLHRDLKPENVMVGEFGEVLVLDWGVAKWTRPEGSVSGRAPGGRGQALEPLEGRSRDASRASDPEAGPPEARGSRGDPAGVGSTVQGTIVGTPAYMAPEQARGEAHLVDERTDVYGLGATLWFLLAGAPPEGPGESPRPAALEAICRRAIAPERAQRYASVGAFAADVQRFLDDAPVLAHREGMLGRAGRFVRRYRVAIGLILAYLAVRTLLWISSRR